MEDGIAGILLIVPAHYGESNDIVLEKTWSEINSHVRAGGLAFMRLFQNDDKGVAIGIVTEVMELNGEYRLMIFLWNTTSLYNCQNENDYPVHYID